MQRAVHIRPLVIAIGGSVAVGKSTVARIIQKLLADTSGLQVQIVTSDGFLYSREELQRRNLMSRKGFPESYDMRSMIDFLAKVRMGQPAQAPTYSHETYDLVHGILDEVNCPDVLIFEGLNVLQVGSLTKSRRPSVATTSDLFDFGIYVDAEPSDIARWYVQRFLLLKATRMRSKGNYFHHLADADPSDALEEGLRFWREINLPN